MQTKIRKLGTEQGLFIPKEYLNELGWMENERVDVSISGDKVVIQKVNSQSRKAEAFEQLKTLKIKTSDFDPKKEKESYLDNKYGI